MRLSARPITNYCNVNDFSFGNQWIIRAGDPNTLYFQVVDLDESTAAPTGSFGNISGGPGCGASMGSAQRYLLGIGTANQPYLVKVRFPSSNNRKVVFLFATQADPNDSSIWTITIPPDLQPFSGNVQFEVIQGQNINRFSVQGMLNVEYPQNEGSC